MLDAGIYSQVGNFPSVADLQGQQQQLATNRLQQMLTQGQVDQIPLRNQLLNLQLSGAQIGNQKQQQLLDLVRSITGGSSAAGQPVSAQPSASAGQPAPVATAYPVSNSPQPAQASQPGALPQLGGLNFPSVVALKTLGGPDLTADYKMAVEGVSHAPGSEVTDVTTGARRTIPTLDKGQYLDASGAVNNLPGYVASSAAAAGATASATEQAKNANTLAPLDRIDPTTGRPYNATVGQLITSANQPPPAPTLIDQQPTASRAAILADMQKRGLTPGDVSVNGQPALAPLQVQLDNAKQGGPEGMAQFQATMLPRILAIQDPQQRTQALAAFNADLQTPAGTPLHSLGRQQQQFSGFAGPAEIAGAKAGAEASAQADVKAKTQPGIEYGTATAKDAAAYKDNLDKTVASGQNLMQRVTESQEALGQFTPGMGADVRLNIARAAKAVGAPQSLIDRINGGDVSAKQEFVKLAAQTAMESLKQSMQGSGRITQAEFKVFQQNNPNIELEPDAIQRIFNFTRQVYQRSLAEQQGYAAYVAHGGDPTQWQALWAAQQDPAGTGVIATQGKPAMNDPLGLRK